MTKTSKTVHQKQRFNKISTSVGHIQSLLKYFSVYKTKMHPFTGYLKKFKQN